MDTVTEVITQASVLKQFVHPHGENTLTRTPRGPGTQAGIQRDTTATGRPHYYCGSCGEIDSLDPELQAEV